MRITEFRKYFLLGLVLFLFILSIFLVWPYITALLASCILAYMFYPIYKKLARYTRSPFFASLLMCILVTLLVLLPFAFFTNMIIQESLSLYSSGALGSVSEQLSTFVGDSAVSDFIEAGVSRVVAAIGNAASSFFVSVPGMILNFLITIYTLFFLFLQGEKIISGLEKDLPLENKKAVFSHLGDMVYGVTYGFFTVALLELVFSAAAFWLLGIRAPFIWALAIGFLALLPLVGPAVVWVPLALIYHFQGMPTQAVGVLIVGLIISGLIDGVIRQKVIGDRTKLHPVVALLGILGGLQVFGFVGVIVGPIVLSSAVVLGQMFYKKYVRK